MMISIRNLLFAILMCLPSHAWSGNPEDIPPSGNSMYVVFIHAGPRKPDDPKIRLLAVRLGQLGYLVRQPEFDQDVVGGPGVDYFRPEAKGTALGLANQVNSLLTELNLQNDPTKMLKPRLQNVKNPPTYFGIWLF